MRDTGNWETEAWLNSVRRHAPQLRTLRLVAVLFLGRAGVGRGQIGENLAALGEEDAGGLVRLVGDAVEVSYRTRDERDVSTRPPLPPYPITSLRLDIPSVDSFRRSQGKNEGTKTLTSWNLPHAPLPDTEHVPRNLDHNPAVKDEENHLHLARILLLLLTLWRQIDHAGAEERQSEGLGVAEGAVVHFACLDGSVGVGDFRYCGLVVRFNAT